GLLPLTVLSRQRQKFSTIRSIVLAQNLLFPTVIVKLIVNSALLCHLLLHTNPKAEGANSLPSERQFIGPSPSPSVGPSPPGIRAHSRVSTEGIGSKNI